MALDKTWFTEINEESGSAFSMKIKEKLHSVTSDYQTIDIYATEGYGNLMVIDGYIMVTDRDNAIYHEMITHPVLFTHPNPERVAIIGGGDCGSLKEVLKHDEVKEVFLIEIDEQVTLTAKKYFPTLTSSNNDERASILFEDGVKWMKGARDLDVIIIDSTDPIGAAAKLFSSDFYADCHTALKDGGLLIHQSDSPLYSMHIIKPMHNDMKTAGFDNTHSLHFFQSSYPSGWWTCTVAGKGVSDLTTFDENRVNNKSFETFYYNADMHRAALATPEFFKRELADT